VRIAQPQDGYETNRLRPFDGGSHFTQIGRSSFRVKALHCRPMCLVPVAVARVALAMVQHKAVSLLGIDVGLIIAYPTAFSINRFMHD